MWSVLDWVGNYKQLHCQYNNTHDCLSTVDHVSSSLLSRNSMVLERERKAEIEREREEWREEGKEGGGERERERMAPQALCICIHSWFHKYYTYTHT